MKCEMCKRERNEYDFDYNPMQVIMGGPLGWYSDKDSEICGDCMDVTLANQ